MTFTRTTTVDASPTGDSVKQAIIDLDTDLSAAYTALNQLNSAIATLVPLSQKGQPNGVAPLDSDGNIPAVHLNGSGVGYTPIGGGIDWWSETLPASGDWLECDGAELSTTTYAELFGIIGYTHGGSGTTFMLPDCRGKFRRGFDHGAGNDLDADDRTGGDAVGSTQADQIKQHCHPIGANSNCQSGGGFNACDIGTRGAHAIAWTHDFDTSQYSKAELDAGSGYGGFAPTGLQTHPINIACMHIIRWR